MENKKAHITGISLTPKFAAQRQLSERMHFSLPVEDTETRTD